MTVHKLDVLNTTPEPNAEEEFSIPLDISDLLYICQEYSKLGLHIQHQIENVLEYGVIDSINKGLVKKESLVYVKDFLKKLASNPYFGDVVSQASDCIYVIEEYEKKNKSFNSLIIYN